MPLRITGRSRSGIAIRRRQAASVIPRDRAQSRRSAPTTSQALTNDQVIAMVKSGMDDDTVAQAIRSAKARSLRPDRRGPAGAHQRRRQCPGAGRHEDRAPRALMRRTASSTASHDEAPTCASAALSSRCWQRLCAQSARGRMTAAAQARILWFRRSSASPAKRQGRI